MKKVALFALVLGLMAPQISEAQEDEIIVTGSRIDTETPGLFLEKTGDFLLLEVSIENDSRDLETRLTEINETVENFIVAAKSDPDISLNIIDDAGLVRPLSLQTFTTGIRTGRRPDTSIAYLKVKTDIPDEVPDSYKLAAKLGEFVESIEEIGRTEISTYDEVAVSVVNPYQYRSDVIEMVVSEINSVTSALGDDYKAIITGLDKDLNWVRSGDLKLAFYLPYKYEIIPTSLQSYTINYVE